VITKFTGVINGAGPSAAPALGALRTHTHTQTDSDRDYFNTLGIKQLALRDECVTSSKSFMRRD